MHSLLFIFPSSLKPPPVILHFIKKAIFFLQYLQCDYIQRNEVMYKEAKSCFSSVQGHDQLDSNFLIVQLTVTRKLVTKMNSQAVAISLAPSYGMIQGNFKCRPK